MVIPPYWQPHHRLDDDELLGFLVPEGDLWVPVTVFGYRLADPGSRLAAESILDGTGLSYLADSWTLALEDGRCISVLITEAGPSRVVVTNADLGFEGDFATRFALEVPDEAATRLSRR